MVGTSERGVSRCCARVRPKFWDWRAMGRSHSHRALPGPHDCLRAGPDCANDHGYAPRAVCRIPPLRLAHALVGDWPSQTSRPGLGQSPHRPYGVARSRRPRGQPAVGATGRSPCGKGVTSPTATRPCGPLRILSLKTDPVSVPVRRTSSGWSRLCQLTTVMRRVRSVAFHRSGRRTRSSKIGPVKPHARDWANLRTGHTVLPDLAVRAVSLP